MKNNIDLSFHDSKIPYEEYISIRESKLRKNYFIAVSTVTDYYDLVAVPNLILVRGNFKILKIPFDFFKPSGNAKPNFTKPYLQDCGTTLVLGDYLANLDSVLYHYDKKFRKKAKKNKIK